MCFLIARWQTVQQWHTGPVTVGNWISDTVLQNLNLPLKFVDIISWLRRNAVWIIHEGPHGIFMGVQLSLVDPTFPTAHVGLREKQRTHNSF